MRALVSLVLVGFLGLLVPTKAPPAPAAEEPFDASVRHTLTFASAQLDRTVRELGATSYPSLTNADGTWQTVGSGDWRSGFLAGSLWRLYELTGNATWMNRATTSEAGVEGQKTNTSTHDVGFIIFNSFGNAFRLAGRDVDRQVVLQTAASLATRYSSKVKAIKSWDGPTSSDFRVIVDNMMNLEILFWASKHGGQAAWYDMAVNHALTTMTNHVRSDGSTYQVVNFDPATGLVKGKSTNQGYNTESTWSRGQAWAVYGFAMAYRETHDERFLQTARRVADYYVSHLPADHVPYWDFEGPGIPNEPRDSSAAAAASSGLLELAGLETDTTRATTYRKAARDALASLMSTTYLAEGTSSHAILLHGAQNKPKGSFNTGLVYGDYYFLEALLRYRSLVGRVTDTTGKAISGATVTFDGGSSRTRVSGDYTIAGIGAGEQSITAAAAGYQSTSKSTTLPGNGSARLDFELTPAAPSPTPPPAPTPTPPPGPTPTPPAGGLRFTPVADAQVKSSSASTNFGTATTIRVREDTASPPITYHSYLRFNVTGLTGTPSAVHLRLYVTDPSADGGKVYKTGTSWSETGITWSNAPAISGTAVGSAGGTPAVGQWEDITITPSAVGANGTYSFALKSASTDSAIYASREDSTHRPELIVTP